MTYPRPTAPLAPWPYDLESRERHDGLDFSVKIKGLTGWYDLEDGVHYAVHGDSFANVAQSYRRREANSEYIEGTFTLAATRENSQESLVVWVRGDSFGEQRRFQDKLCRDVEQLSWMVMRRYEDMAEYWQCFASDYSVESQREFLHARLAIVRINVNRLPGVTVVDATSDER